LERCPAGFILLICVSSGCKQHVYRWERAGADGRHERRIAMIVLQLNAGASFDQQLHHVHVPTGCSDQQSGGVISRARVHWDAAVEQGTREANWSTFAAINSPYLRGTTPSGTGRLAFVTFSSINSAAIEVEIVIEGLPS